MRKVLQRRKTALLRILLALGLVILVGTVSAVAPELEKAYAAEEGAKGQAPPSGGSSKIVRIIVDGPINPITAEYIEHHLEKAGDEGAALVIIQLDTPGGLMESTRQIVKAEFGSKVPVAVYVAPPGARAASAGVFITMAAHVAAMAPGTNIGAAHPVNIGGGFPGQRKEEKEKEETKKEGDPSTGSEQEQEAEEGKEKQQPTEPAPQGNEIMAQKILNDTVAFVRTIAERYDRNADWAERAVRESISATEKEALEEGVIDVVAENVDELIGKIDGRVVKVTGEDRSLSVAGLEVEDRPMDWRRRILATVTNPNVAYILMMLGIYGVFFELANPGVVLPGVLGGIFLILAFFAFQVLPINYAGVLLILLAVILFILEVKVVSFGMLTVGGIISLFLGSIMLFDSPEPYFRISRVLILSFTGFTALFFVLGLGMAFRAQRRRPTTGFSGLIGKRGVATTDLSPVGKVKVHGEIWTARSEGFIQAGQGVVVVGSEGMSLNVVAEEGSDDSEGTSVQGQG